MAAFSLSIVVPVYNVEAYITACTDSLFAEILPEIEYIFVNDASPDRSMELIREQIVKYQVPGDQVQLLENARNSGLSVTRNVGAAAARGAYLWFVDSDDWIDGHKLPGLLTCLKENKPEILALEAARVYPDQREESCTVYLKPFQFGQMYAGKMFLRNCLPCAPFYVFERAFWQNNQFSFYPGIYHEDTELTPKVRYLAQRAMVFEGVIYYYRTAEGSIVSVPKLKRIEDLLIVIGQLKTFMDSSVADLDKPLFCDICAVSLMNSFWVASQLPQHEQKIFVQMLREKREFCQILRGCSKWKHRLVRFFLPWGSSAVLSMYRVYRKIK